MVIHKREIDHTAPDGFFELTDQEVDILDAMGELGEDENETDWLITD